MPHRQEGKGITLVLVFIVLAGAISLRQALDSVHASSSCAGKDFGIQDPVLRTEDQNRLRTGFETAGIRGLTEDRINVYAPRLVESLDDAMGYPLQIRTLIYHDQRYPNSWCSKDTSDFLVRYLERVLGSMGVEYLVLDADQLKENLLSSDPRRSILVFSQDIAPDTIWNGSPSSPIVSWLYRGGTVIWTGDWEFYFIGFRNGSCVHKTGIESIPFGRRVTISLKSLTQDQPIDLQMNDLGITYMPSARSVISLRPFDAESIEGFGNEVYGFSWIGSTAVVDPGLLKVGEGSFVKIGAIGDRLGAIDRASMIAEFLVNRIYGLRIDLRQGSRCFNSEDSGIVYILPSGASSAYWKRTYGSRIYFYVHSNVSESRSNIMSDLRLIAQKYGYIMIMIPIEDTELFYHNMNEMDSLAGEVGLQILYILLPKDKYGPEWDYLSPGSMKYDLMVSDMRFLSRLPRTKGIAVWYGWRGRPACPSEIRTFWESLPYEVRHKYQVWIDQPFVQKVVESGMAYLANELNLTILTELYSDEALALYGSAFEHQTIVTGCNNASSISQWVLRVRSRIDCVLNLSDDTVEKRGLGIWIFWDSEENERFRSYIDRTLVNPFHIETSATAPIIHDRRVCLGSIVKPLHF